MNQTMRYFVMQAGKPETAQEKAVRLAREGGAAYPETVVALLQPYEERRGIYTHLYANVDGEALPFEAAVAKVRDGNPVLGPLFQPGGRPDVTQLTHEQFLAVRATAPELLGLRPKAK